MNVGIFVLLCLVVVGVVMGIGRLIYGPDFFKASGPPPSDTEIGTMGIASSMSRRPMAAATVAMAAVADKDTAENQGGHKRIK